jgi:hypothetical protein
MKKKMKKIILDLCGGTGAWSKPYKDAGYDVRVITLPEYDVRTYTPPHRCLWDLGSTTLHTFFFKRRTLVESKGPRRKNFKGFGNNNGVFDSNCQMQTKVLGDRKSCRTTVSMAGKTKNVLQSIRIRRIQSKTLKGPLPKKNLSVGKFLRAAAFIFAPDNKIQYKKQRGLASQWSKQTKRNVLSDLESHNTGGICQSVL